MSEMLKKARAYEAEKAAQTDKNTRPLFHISAPAGWINDPNGFSVYDGKIHLFYQYYPYAREWGPMHWGHSVTTDMISWEQLPAALAPDQDYDRIVGVVSTEAMRRAQEGDAGLARVLLSSPDPAEMAYTLGKRWEFEAMQRGQSVGGSAGSKTHPQMPRGAAVPGGGGTSGFDLEGYLNLSGDEYARLPREVRQEIDKRMRSIG